MGLMSRMLLSWRLGWSGLRVIGNDKTLLGFPAVTVAAIIAILSLIYIVIGPNIQLLILAVLPSINAPNHSGMFWTLLVLWYFLLAFVAVFMQVALVGAVNISMNQRDSKFIDGLVVAGRFLPSLLLWTFVQYTFGFLLSLLDLSRHTSRFVRKIFGAAWSVITYLAVPVMVVEGRSIFGGFRQAGDLMEKTWGRNLHPTFSLGYFFTLLNLPTLAFALYVYTQAPEQRLIPEFFAAMYFLLTLVVIQASRSVLMVALYQYAATGTAPAAFNGEFLKQAFISWDDVVLPVTEEKEEAPETTVN